MKEELQKLIEQYGADAVAKAAAEALNKHVPTINTPVVTDEQLINTISQLDAAVTDILEAGRKNEETYQNKVELARRARQLGDSVNQLFVCHYRGVNGRYVLIQGFGCRFCYGVRAVLFNKFL